MNISVLEITLFIIFIYLLKQQKFSLFIVIFSVLFIILYSINRIFVLIYNPNNCNITEKKDYRCESNYDCRGIRKCTSTGICIGKSNCN